MHKGGVGVGIELLIQLSPRPTPFSDREDDASSINWPQLRRAPNRSVVVMKQGVKILIVWIFWLDKTVFSQMYIWGFGGSENRTKNQVKIF